MLYEPEKQSNRIKKYAILIGILYLAMQHAFYLAGHHLASWIGITPVLPKVPLDDLIPIVSIFIIPYIWSYAYWAMGPMIVSKCEKEHFKDFLAALLLSCVHCMDSTLCYLGVAGRKEIPLWIRIYSLVITILIYASTVFVKQHYVLDIVSGVLLAVIAYAVCKKFHWGRMFAPVERLVNKWKKQAAR